MDSLELPELAKSWQIRVSFIQVYKSIPIWSECRLVSNLAYQQGESLGLGLHADAEGG